MSGCEWLIEAHGCDGDALRDVSRLRALFDRIVEGLALHPVEEPTWHQFPGEGGVTGVCLLSESHLACHTFPEHQSLCLNVFCCRPRPEWDFAAYLREEFGAGKVHVRQVERPYR
jgi:S-adenosylmethionine decarboxylase